MTIPDHSQTIHAVDRAPTPVMDRRRWSLMLVLGALAIALAHALDHVTWSIVRDANVYERDWGRLLRMLGYLPTWLIIAIGCWTSDYPRYGWKWRGGLLFVAPVAGGALAELLKLCVRRLRPDPEHFQYVFRAMTDHPFGNGGLGMPSSHTLVAFAGATALAHVFPKAAWLWYALAVGCAITRVLAVAHFLSDTVVAAVLGFLVGDVLSRCWSRAVLTHSSLSRSFS